MEKMKPRFPVTNFLLFFLFYLLFSPAHSLEFGRKKHTINGPIKTIVVLVMENRSFDHMLGWLKLLNPEIDGVTGSESNPMNASDPNSPAVYFKADSEFVDADPGHSFQAITEQIFASNDTSADPAPMNGFAQQAESMSEGFSSTVMSGFKPENVPVFTALAMEFAVCDRWFASVPTSTQPNRLYAHSATSYGLSSNVKKDLAEGFPQRTIFDSLHEEGLSFGIYYQNLPAVLFFRSLRKLKYITKFHLYDLAFKKHAREGSLPNYVVVEQRYFDRKITPANDDHPSHDVSEGQKFVKEVYETLRASPQWNETLFVVTYDEHGGFYDHVPTPVRHVPNPDNLIGPAPFYFNFDRLGVRVPTLLISPWINKGTVLHEPDGPTPFSQFEHSSLPATVKRLFNLKSDFLSRRDAWAGSFENILYARDFPRTDCPEELPTPPLSLRHSEPNEAGKLTEFQEELVQLAAQLNGDHLLHSYPDMGKSMTVKEANEYVADSVSYFLEAGQVALKAGINDSSIVEIRPYLKARRAGLFKSALLQYE